jgi:hypothetical protein
MSISLTLRFLKMNASSCHSIRLYAATKTIAASVGRGKYCKYGTKNDVASSTIIPLIKPAKFVTPPALYKIRDRGRDPKTM